MNVLNFAFKKKLGGQKHFLKGAFLFFFQLKNDKKNAQKKFTGKCMRMLETQKTKQKQFQVFVMQNQHGIVFLEDSPPSLLFLSIFFVRNYLCTNFYDSSKKR